MEEIKPEEGTQTLYSNDLTESAEDSFLSGIFSKKIASFVIGLVVVVALVGGGVYSVLNNTKKKPAQPIVVSKNIKSTPKVTSTPKATATPTPQTIAKKNPPSVKPTSLPAQKNNSQVLRKEYSDTLFGYAFKAPSKWDVMKGQGDNNAYQTILRPEGSMDNPITINTQINETGENLSEWIDSLYGFQYPRALKKIGGKDAIFVQNPTYSYNSYFVMNEEKVYEFSVSTVREEYMKIFDQLLSSVQFASK